MHQLTVCCHLIHSVLVLKRLMFLEAVCFCQQICFLVSRLTALAACRCIIIHNRCLSWLGLPATTPCCSVSGMLQCVLWLTAVSHCQARQKQIHALHSSVCVPDSNWAMWLVIANQLQDQSHYVMITGWINMQCLYCWNVVGITKVFIVGPTYLEQVNQCCHGWAGGVIRTIPYCYW